jgi:hypothetical protein
MTRDASFSHPILACKQPMQVLRNQIHAAKYGSGRNPFAFNSFAVTSIVAACAATLSESSTRLHVLNEHAQEVGSIRDCSSRTAFVILAALNMIS